MSTIRHNLQENAKIVYAPNLNKIIKKVQITPITKEKSRKFSYGKQELCIFRNMDYNIDLNQIRRMLALLRWKLKVDKFKSYKKKYLDVLNYLTGLKVNKYA